MMPLPAHAVAAPLVVTVQTALLGHYGGSASQAAFAAVGTTANATCLLFNFLVDGISAKVCIHTLQQDLVQHTSRGCPECFMLLLHFSQVGHSAGAGKLDVLRQKVRLAILCALAAGATAFVALAALQYPVSTFFALTSEVCASSALTMWCLPLDGMHDQVVYATFAPARCIAKWYMRNLPEPLPTSKRSRNAMLY